MLGHQTVKRKHDLYLTETPENPDRPHHSTEVWSGLRGVLAQKSLTETPVCPVHSLCHWKRHMQYPSARERQMPRRVQNFSFQDTKRLGERILVKNLSNQYVKIWKEYCDHKIFINLKYI